jgi:hypothetical protein
MSYAICLDQNTPNFNINNLSANGFSIYANLGNGFNTVIAQGIPANLLFPFPNGTCPYNVTLPQGTTQILVVDQCTFELNVASVFSPENVAAGNITTTCCYAIINISQEPVPPPTFCETCTLTFDTFLTATTGSIIAGNLSSTCGPVTDYTIGWYLNGNYSAPAITSGYGNTFTYQFQHPLTGNSAVPVLAGNWEGIIHDITINGVTYSSVSGSASGQSIPFESCFGTVVAQPLKCNNGTSSGKYLHQKTFNSQAVGTIPAPVSLTYALDTTTKHFAYTFKGFSIWDEIEIKWKSGNPSATPSPNFYTQSIYLEKLRVGNDVYSYAAPIINGGGIVIPTTTTSSFSNVWPKATDGIGGWVQRVLTLTNLPTSSNPLFPDTLEITITPNPDNNNTQWQAGFTCLNTFDCTNCIFDNYPNNLPKINQINLIKQYTCPQQSVQLNFTGCDPLNSLTNTDLLGKYIWQYGITNPTLNLVGSQVFNGAVASYISLTGQTSCYEVRWVNSPTWPINNTAPYPNYCSIPNNVNTTITLNKTPNFIELEFNDYNDYLYYKTSLINIVSSNNPNFTTPKSCSNNNIDYYQVYSITVPVQGPNANCGDNTTPERYFFHVNDYLNVLYTENAPSNYWSIKIPQTTIVNCYVPSNCSNCYNYVDNFVIGYNNHVNNAILSTFTTYVGAKYNDPFLHHYIMQNSVGGASGPYCLNTTTQNVMFIPWYSVNTIPFIPDASNPGSWINLPSLAATLPCDFSVFIREGSNYNGYWGKWKIRFPNLTSSFNYTLSTNDFQVYASSGPAYPITGGYLPSYNSSCTGSLIYDYIGGVPTVYNPSYFAGGSPTLFVMP